MNFNVVQKPKKKELIDEEEEIEIEEEEVKVKKSSSDPKKRMIRFMLIIVGFAVLLILILFIISLFSHREYTYEEIEKIMEDAAISYFKDYPEALPSEEGSVVEIDSSNLAVAGKMKELSEYTAEGVVCTGKVLIEKFSSDYIYKPVLNCGDNYSTVELYNKIIDGNIVSSGYGLYETTGGTYAYRGETVNNYLKLDKSLWRIVKITSNNELVLISDAGTLYGKPWDDRYNEDRLYDSGVNRYSSSRVLEFLEKIYKNPDESEGEVLLSKKDKARLIKFNQCTGKRTPTSESRDNSMECSEILSDQKLGLLTLSDYMYASIDTNCKSASTKNCKNYNYLVLDEEWWLATGNSEDTSTVYNVDGSGIVSVVNANGYSKVRPVIRISGEVLYKSGNGSKEKPYKIR